jgi:soluble lytic murein transglycosylase
MSGRSSFVAAARFDAAVRVSGLASDERLVGLLHDVIDVPRYRLAGGYHYARALERLGRHEEAESHYLRIYQIDNTDTRYYALWAEQRLWAMQNEHKLRCMPALGAIDEALASDRSGRAARPASAIARPRLPDDMAPEEARGRAVALLEPVVLAHGEAYPWLGRALDLVHLSLFDEAADELNETYMAFRDAKGSPRLRSGLEAVFTGEAPARRAADFALRRARLALEQDRQSRNALERVAELVGDPGVGLRFGDFRLGERPRAYATQVERAAKKYGLDPNLLFAVMRVESIYNRRIVSYAGAVGLMQIMPATGKRIADRLGVSGFQTTDLLDPRTNLEFSAWYLSSLLDRFDGRLPLAIASYNGGPHNVRLWMRDNHSDMPLDAFLERIPFTQTHRYVRRVLTHYAAYRAQQALPMTRLDVTLPQPEPDPIAF